ncbi:MAG: RICIN domain-containing protein [Aquabacterium sp.]|nr:RICIN domain-containing protein [Aquabacterium sp.]
MGLAVTLAGCGGGGKQDGATVAASAEPVGTARILAVASEGGGATSWVTLPAIADPMLQNLAIPADAATRGMWSPTVAWPLNAIHAAQLSDGRVLTYGTPFGNAGAQDGRFYDIWDPSQGFGAASHVSSTVPDPVNSFCSTAMWVADGRLLISGGNGDGGRSSGLFSTTNSTSTALGARLAQERWYATMITLADGRGLIMGGSVPYPGPMTAPTPEVYENGQWRSLFGATSVPMFATRGAAETWYYPRAWAAPDGSVFGITSSLMFRLQPDANNRSGSITQVGTFKRVQDPTSAVTPNVGFTSTAVMYDVGRILQVGGNGSTDNNPNLASQSATIIDINGAAPVLIETAPMANRRHWANANVLPGGQVVVTGGSTIGWQNANAVFAAEIWNPATGQWTTGARNAVNRTYHSSSILLANGTVLTAGGGAPGAVNNLNADVYYPPQLFRTVGGRAELAPRPVLQAITALNGAYAGALGLRLAAASATTAISQVSLVALGNTTHGYNTSQRRVPLTFTRAGDTLSANLPASANLAPPGYYMVFVIDANGVPSRGTIIALGNMARPSIQGVSGPPAGAVACAPEGGVCNLPAGTTASVYFGSGARFVVKTGLSGAVACTNANFGDPAPGAIKACSYLPETAEAAVPPVETPPATAGAAVTFNAAAQAGATSSWNFGDGSAATAFSTSPTATKVFTQPGVYNVTLTVRASTGAINSRTFLQAVGGARTAVQPTASSAMALEPRAGASARLWVVNPDADTVAVLDTATNQRVAELAVGRQPVSVAVAGNGRIWVVNKAAASISIINAATLAVERTVALPAASQPHGLAFAPAGGAAFVALEGAGQLLRLDATTAAQTSALALPGAVRNVSVRGDGSQVLVTRFITAALPGEGTATVNTAAGGGEVHVVAAATMTLARTVLLRHSDRTDSELQGSGIPNYLGAAVISPDGATAWVPSKQDNIRRGMLRNGQNLDFQNTVRAISARIDLATLTEDPARRVDHDNASLGSAAAFHPNGAYLFVALETSREVAVMDAYGSRELFKVDVGLAPQAVAVSADGRTLYVQNFMGRSVSVLDLTALITQGERLVTPRATTGTASVERLPAQVLLGKQLFYDARDPRLSRDRYMSCASCHSDGGQDGRTWDLTGFGEGLRNTVSLKGRSGMGHGLLHWSGNFDEVQDFEVQIRALAGGTGLMPDAAYFTGTRSEPLGDRKAGVSADLDALAAYVTSLRTADPSPWRNADRTLTTAALAGRAVFEANSCASCHTGSNFSSSSATGGMRGIGTQRPASGNRLGAPLTGIDVPSLRGLWATAPYLHDGSAATLEAAVAAHSTNTVPAADLPNLAAYLRSLDGSDPAPTQPLPNGVYRLVAQHSGQTLNIGGISQAAGAAAIQWPWLGGDNERWRLARQPDGSVTFAAQHSGQLLEVAGCSVADGARIQQLPANGTACQRWRLQPVADGSFNVVNLASGKLLNIGGASQAAGAVAIQWPLANAANERWRLEPVSANGVAAGFYTLTAAHSAKVLDVAGISPAAGANVHQWAATGSLNQQWNVTPTADGYFELAPAHARPMRLEVAAGATALGGNVQQGLASGSAAQRWGFERQPDGSWRLSNANSGLSLDVAGAAQADGGNVYQWEWINVANQRWTLRALAAPAAPLLGAGRSVGFEALSWPGYRIRHANFLGFISPVSAASAVADRQDSSFITRTGLGSAACWSFESRNFPGHYLRSDATARLVLAPRLATTDFAADATFCARPPNSAAGGAGAVTLESFSAPGRVIRHRNFELWLDTNDGSAVFPGDSSFRVQPALAP